MISAWTVLLWYLYRHSLAVDLRHNLGFDCQIQTSCNHLNKLFWIEPFILLPLLAKQWFRHQLVNQRSHSFLISFFTPHFNDCHHATRFSERACKGCLPDNLRPFHFPCKKRSRFEFSFSLFLRFFYETWQQVRLPLYTVWCVWFIVQFLLLAIELIASVCQRCPTPLFSWEECIKTIGRTGEGSWFWIPQSRTNTGRRVAKNRGGFIDNLKTATCEAWQILFSIDFKKFPDKRQTHWYLSRVWECCFVESRSSCVLRPFQESEVTLKAWKGACASFDTQKDDDAELSERSERWRKVRW